MEAETAPSTLVPENNVYYFTVRVKLMAGASTIQATILGFHSVLIVDTGSSISLIQPGVCSSEVKPTSLAPFGVMDNKLEIKEIQEVEFHLEDWKFHHRFCACSLPTDADGISFRKECQLESGKIRARSAEMFQL